MRRETLMRAVKRVYDDLDETGMRMMLDDIVQRSRPGSKEDSGVTVSFETFRNYMIRTAAYGDTEQYILNVLALDDLLQPSFWQRMGKEIDRPQVFSLSSRIRFATDGLPRLLELLDREYGETPEVGHSPAAKDDSLLIQTVVLNDDSDHLSSPERLIYVLESVRDFYSVISQLDNQDDRTLSIVGMDSGSEKSFDFMGVAKFVQELRETILALWQNVIYHKQNLAVRNLAMVDEALPLIAKIHKLEAESAIDNETSMRLKNRVLQAATKFLDAGATIPEMGTHSRFDPQILMRPQPKLLAAPTNSLVAPQRPRSLRDDEAAESESRRAPSAADLTAEQIAAIAAIVQGNATNHHPETTKTRSRAPRKKRTPPSSGS